MIIKVRKEREIPHGFVSLGAWAKIHGYFEAYYRIRKRVQRGIENGVFGDTVFYRIRFSQSSKIRYYIQKDTPFNYDEIFEKTETVRGWARHQVSEFNGIFSGRQMAFNNKYFQIPEEAVVKNPGYKFKRYVPYLQFPPIALISWFKSPFRARVIRIRTGEGENDFIEYHPPRDAVEVGFPEYFNYQSMFDYVYMKKRYDAQVEKMMVKMGKRSGRTILLAELRQKYLKRMKWLLQ